MDYSTICILILIGMLICYITRIIPIGVTSICGALLTAAFGINSLSNVTAQFVNDIILLQIGVMIIGDAFFEAGLADDLGDFIERRFSKNEKILMIAIITITSLVAAVISNTATVALFLPIVIAIEVSSKGKIKRKNIFMALGFASVLGGNVTLFGSTPQLAVQSILLNSELPGVRGLGVFELTLPAIPLVVLLILFYAFVGDKLQRKIFKNNSVESNTVVDRQKKNAPMYKKVAVCVIYILCIVFFVWGIIPVGITAIIGASLCIALRCIGEKHAYQSVEWTTVIMLAGILAFSDSFAKSGAGEVIVNWVLSLFGGEILSPMAMYSIVVVCAIVLTSVMSNTAVAAMLAPMGIEMALKCGANPMTFVIGVILAANISFCTPIASAPVTMTVSAGYKFSDYFIIGGLFSIIAGIYIIVGVPLMLGM